MEQTEDWRARVGSRVESRRRALFPSRRKAAEAAGISEIVWRQIESGQRQVAPGSFVAPNPTAQTTFRICSALGWTPDSIDRLLRGEDPIDLVDAANGMRGVDAPTDRADARRQAERHYLEAEMARRRGDEAGALEALATAKMYDRLRRPADPDDMYAGAAQSAILGGILPMEEDYDAARREMKPDPNERLDAIERKLSELQSAVEELVQVVREGRASA